MINEIQVRQIFEGCGFVHAPAKKAKKEKSKDEPGEDFLNDVVKQVKIHNGLTRIELIKLVKMSEPTLKKCLSFLVENGELIKNTAGVKTPFAERIYVETDKARLVY